MENLKNLIAWLQGLSPFSRVLSVIIAALVAIIVLFGCGTTRAVVHTKDSGTATITITTNNPIDVSTTPNINVELPLKSN